MKLLMNRRETGFFLYVLSKQKETVTEYELVNGDSGEWCWTFFQNQGEIKKLKLFQMVPSETKQNIGR